MHYFAAWLISLLFSINIVHAADYILEDIEQIKLSSFATKRLDINLIIPDDFDNNHLFKLHSDILKHSKYFNINYQLSQKDPNVDLELKFHTPSIPIFKKLLNIMYGGEIAFDDFNELMAIVTIQERLEIEQLDLIIHEIVNNMLPKISTRDMAKILKFMRRSHRSSATACSAIILAYIAENHNKEKNCLRSELVTYLGNEILGEVDEIISGPRIEEANIRNSLAFDKYERKIFDKAQKIANKNKQPGTSIAVFNSEQDTKNVMLILNKKYNISSNLDKKNGLKNKYQIKITG